VPALPNILLVKCGSAAPGVRLTHGDYDRWFRRALAPAGVAVRMIEAHAGAPLPLRARAEAIVVTGSPRSVTERAAWMVGLGAWLREEAERGAPVLGVCFGHQLLAEAFGGAVGRNPLGRELGTVRCALTPEGREDPLFEGIPAEFEVQATHEDDVRALPPRAELLATNAWSRVQAFRIGGNVRAVQFHPEMDGAATAAVAASRAAGLAAEARERGEDADGRARAVLAGIRGTPWGARILRNFVERFGGAAPARRARPPTPPGSSRRP
jgi:GMP synthase (glutamine-hydrolysing)